MTRRPNQHRSTRRTFLGQTLAAGVMPGFASSFRRSPATAAQAAAPIQSGATLRVEGNRIMAESATLTATLENSRISR